MIVCNTFLLMIKCSQSNLNAGLGICYPLLLLPSLNLITNYSENMKNIKLTGSIMIYLRKAFDTIGNALLLIKLAQGVWSGGHRNQIVPITLV